MKLRLPHRLQAALVAALASVSFTTLSSGTLSAAFFFGSQSFAEDSANKSGATIDIEDTNLDAQAAIDEEEGKGETKEPGSTPTGHVGFNGTRGSSDDFDRQSTAEATTESSIDTENVGTADQANYTGTSADLPSDDLGFTSNPYASGSDTSNGSVVDSPVTSFTQAPQIAPTGGDSAAGIGSGSTTSGSTSSETSTSPGVSIGSGLGAFGGSPVRLAAPALLGAAGADAAPRPAYSGTILTWDNVLSGKSSDLAYGYYRTTTYDSGTGTFSVGEGQGGWKSPNQGLIGTNDDNIRNTLRFAASDYGQTVKTPVYTFTPLALAGFIVDTGAIGFSVNSSGAANVDRSFYLGNNNATAALSTINEDFTFNMGTGNGKVYLRGTQTIDVARGKVFTLGSSNGMELTSNLNMTLAGGGTMMLRTNADVTSDAASVVTLAEDSTLQVRADGNTRTYSFNNLEVSGTGHLSIADSGTGGQGYQATVNIGNLSNADSSSAVLSLGNAARSSGSVININGGSFNGEIVVRGEATAGTRKTAVQLGDATVARNAVVSFDVLSGKSGNNNVGLGIGTNVSVKGINTASAVDSTIYSGSKSAGFSDFNSGSDRYSITITGDGSYSTSATVKNNLNIVMSGTGTQAFSGNMSAFDGSITVTSGTLTLGSAVAGASTVSVTGGTLDLGAALTTTGNLSVANGATLKLAGAGADLLSVNGDLTLGGSLDVSRIAYAEGATVNLASYTGTANYAGATITGLAAGQTGTLGVDANNHLTLTFGSQPEPKEGTFHVYVLTGQSNSLGAVKGNPLSAELLAAYQSQNVKMWDANMGGSVTGGDNMETAWNNEGKTWIDLQPARTPGSNVAGTDWEGLTYPTSLVSNWGGNTVMGPEYGFGYMLEKKGWFLGEDDGLGVIKASRDGGGDNNWVKGNKGYSTLLNSIKLALNEAEELGYETVSLDGLMYLQGESNGSGGTGVQDRYLALLSNLKQDLTDAGYDASKLTFDTNSVLGEIATWNQTDTSLGNDKNNTVQYQEALADSSDDIGYVHTRDLDKITPGDGMGVHYNGEAQLTIGARYAYAFAVQNSIDVGTVRGDNDQVNLNEAGAWWMNQLPGQDAVVVWDLSSVSTPSSAAQLAGYGNNIASGQTLTVGGVRIEDPYKQGVIINGGTLSIGSSGIELQGGDLSISSDIDARASQTWNTVYTPEGGTQQNHQLTTSGTVNIQGGATLTIADDSEWQFNVVHGTGNLVVNDGATLSMTQEDLNNHATGGSGYSDGNNGFLSGSFDLITLTGDNSSIDIDPTQITWGGALADKEITLSDDDKKLQILNGESSVYYVRDGVVVYDTATGITDATSININDMASTGATLELANALASGVSITSSGNGGAIKIDNGVTLDRGSLGPLGAQLELKGDGVYHVSGWNNNFTQQNGYGLGSNVALDSDWTGTVQLESSTSNGGTLVDFAHLANGSLSTVELKGLNGWTSDWEGTIAENLKLTDVNGTAAWTNAASSSQSVKTATLSGDWSGDGTFKLTNANRMNYTYTGDISEWHGKFQKTGNGQTDLTFSGAADTVNASIVREGGTLNLIVETDATFSENVTGINNLTTFVGTRVAFNGENTSISGTSSIGGTVTNGGTMTLAGSVAVTGTLMQDYELYEKGSVEEYSGTGAYAGNGYLTTDSKFYLVKNVNGGTLSSTATARDANVTLSSLGDGSLVFQNTAEGNIYYVNGELNWGDTMGETRTTEVAVASDASLKLTGLANKNIVGSGTVKIDAGANADYQYHDQTFLENFTGTVEVVSGKVQLGKQSNKFANATLKVSGGDIRGWSGNFSHDVILAGGSIADAGNNETYSGKITLEANSKIGRSDGDKKLTFTGSITGAYTLTTQGGNNASFDFNGATDIAGLALGAGTVNINNTAQVGAISGTGNVNVNANGSLSLEKTSSFTGNMTVVTGATLALAGEEMLTLSGTLTLESGSRLDLARIFETQEAPVQANLFQAAPKANSLLSVGGDSAGGGSLSGALLGAATPAPGDYILATAGSITLNEGVLLDNIAAGYTGTLKTQDAGGNKQLILTLTADYDGLIWNGPDGNWSNATDADLNWHMAAAPGTSVAFTTGQNVRFDSNADGHTVTLTENITAGTVEIQKGVAVKIVDGNNKTLSGTLIGAGTYVLNAGDKTLPGSLNVSATDWSGVVRLSGTHQNLSLSGDMQGLNSTVELKGVTGWFSEVAKDLTDTFSNDLVLTNDNTTAAVTITAGYSRDRNYYKFAGKVSGDGTFEVNAGATNRFIFSGDVSDWKGQFHVTNAGANNAGAYGANGSEIVFADDAHVVNATLTRAGGTMNLVADTDTTFNKAVTGFSKLTVTEGNTATFKDVLTQPGNVALAGTLVVDSDSTTASSISGTISGGGNLVKNGTGTLNLGGNAHTISDLTINEGVVTTTRSNQTASVSGTININGGGTFAVDGGNDAFGWGDTRTSKIVMEGEAGEGNKATLALNQSSGTTTMATDLEMKGYSQITGAQGFNSFGGTINVTGTDNSIQKMVVRKELALTVESGGELAIASIDKSTDQGNGVMNKLGDGTLTLGGNANVAALNVNAGTLALTSTVNTITGNLSVAGGATLVLNEMGDDAVSTTGTLTLGDNSILDLSALSISGTETTPITLIQGGTIDETYLSSVDIKFAQGVTPENYTLSKSGNNLVLTFSPAGQNLIWDGTNGTAWTTDDTVLNWHTTEGTPGSSAFAQNDSVTFQGANDSVVLQEAINTRTMTLDNGAGLTVDTNGNKLTVQKLVSANGADLTKTGAGVAEFGGNGSDLVLGDVVISEGSASFNNAPLTADSLSVSGFGTTAGIEKKMSVAGTVSVDGATLTVGGEEANPTTTIGALSLANDATVNLNGAGRNKTIANIGSISGDGNINISSVNANRTYNITGDISGWNGAITQAATAGSMTLNISGTNTVNADIVNSAKTNPASILTLNLQKDMTVNGKVEYTAVAPIDMNVGNSGTAADVSFTNEVKVRNLNVANAGSSATFRGPTQINGTISGNGEMTVNSGSNTVTVEGANNLKGDTTVTAGTLLLNGGGNMGDVIVNGGEFNTTGAQAITLNRLSVTDGTAHVGNSGNVNLGTVSLTGGDLVLNTTVSAGSLTTTSGATLTFAGENMLTTTGDIDLSGGLQLDLSNITYRTDTSDVQTITLATTSGAITLGGTYTFLNTKTAEGTASFTLKDDGNNHLVLEVVYNDVTNWPDNTKVSYTYTPQGGTEEVHYDIKVKDTNPHGYNFSQAEGGVVEFNPNLFDNDTHTYTDSHNIVMHSDTTIVVEEGNTVKLTGELSSENYSGGGISGTLIKDGAGTLEMAINDKSTGPDDYQRNTFEGSVEVSEGTLHVLHGQNGSELAAGDGAHVRVSKGATLDLEEGVSIGIPSGHRTRPEEGDDRSVVISAYEGGAIIQNAYISQDGIRPEDARDGGRARVENAYELRIGNLKDMTQAISIELADITSVDVTLDGTTTIDNSNIDVSAMLFINNDVGAPNKIQNNSTINFTGYWGVINNSDVDKTSKINSEQERLFLTGANKVEVGSTENGGVATRVLGTDSITYTSDQYKGLVLGTDYYKSDLSLGITLSDVDLPDDLTGYTFTLTFEDFNTSYVFGEASSEFIPLEDLDLNVSLFIPAYAGGQWEELVASVQVKYDTTGNTVFMFEHIMTPEPTTSTLSLLALAALAARRRRK